MDIRHAHAVAVGKRRERGHFADEPVEREFMFVLVDHDLLRGGVECGERGDGADEHPHRMGVVMEAVHELLDVFVDERVRGDVSRSIRRAVPWSGSSP